MSLFYIAQIISVVTLIATVFGILQKEKFKSMLWFTLANLAMIATFVLLERYLAVILVGGAALRTFVYYLYAAKNKKANSLVMIFFQAYFVIVSLFLWKDIYDLLMLANLVMLTFTTWQDNMQTFRFGYIFSGVLLITYDVFVGAYVNIVSDAILLIFSAIAVYKYDYKNRIKDIVLDFYETIAPTYKMTLTKKQTFTLIVSEAITDVYNNFAYMPDVMNFSKCSNKIKNDLTKANRTPSIYLQSVANEKIPYIMEHVKNNKLLFHDVWMKLRSGYNTKYKKCLLKDVTFKMCDETQKKEILDIFVRGFVKDVGEGIYKYEDSYTIKYKNLLDNKELAKYKITPYMAYHQGKAIALLFIYKKDYHAYLCQITTLTRYRRRGVASSLIRYAVDNERRLGINDFYLITEKYTFLETFYMKNNFEEISQGFCIEINDKRPKIIRRKNEVPTREEVLPPP